MGSGDSGPSGACLVAGPAFYHAHGLGNDYLVFEAVGVSGPPAWPVTGRTIRSICHHGVGPGSDGLVLLASRYPPDGVFEARGYNPDGSEFERSGNGLRVLGSHLHREGLVGHGPFAVRFGPAPVRMTVHEAGEGGRYDISVEMGRAETGLAAVDGDPSALDGRGRALHPSRGPIGFFPVSVGNPHAVVFSDGEGLAEIGPFLSTHPAFPSGVNVQLAEVEGPGRLRIRIWERGAGATSASGTSATAAAVAAVRTGRIEPGEVRVRMEGGTLLVRVARELSVTLRGPVDEIAEGRLAEGYLERLRRLAPRSGAGGRASGPDPPDEQES